MRKIPFQLLISLVFISLFAGNASYHINSLRKNDNTYNKFSKNIKKNHKNWRKLKKHFDLSQLSNFKRLSIAIYRTKSNDSIVSIAEKLGMNADTLISFNSLINKHAISPGTEILIPNMDGVVLFPKNKTSLEKISRIYKVPIELLMYINNIQRKYVYSKEELFIPFARLSEEEKKYFFSNPFIMPLKGGRFTSIYGIRRDPFTYRWTFHGGVDLAVPMRTKVYASAPGTVIVSGWNGGYGKLVVIKHKYGYTTWYGHLSRPLVRKGQYVKQGQLIALSGNTGRSTGPHLHFEMRRFNRRKNPLEVLDFHHVIRKR